MNALNLYLRPAQSHSRWLYGCAFLLILAGAGLGWTTLAEYRLAEHAQERNGKLAASLGAQKVPTMGRVEQENMKRWGQLKMERDFPWEQVFRAVEKSASTDIELLEFKPDKMNRAIGLSGEARNRKALLTYLEQLSKQTALTGVYLTHQQTVQRENLETISFEIKATLKE
jgi:hypothetical protein